MNAAALISDARHRAGLTLRRLGELAGTSHSAIAAYESNRTVPSVDTLERVVRATGHDLDVRIERRVRERDGLSRGGELREVLDLADRFPTRHSPTMEAPIFPRRTPDC